VINFQNVNVPPLFPSIPSRPPNFPLFLKCVLNLLKKSMDTLGSECAIWNATKHQSRATVQKWNQKQAHPRAILSPNLPRDTRVKVTLVTRPLLTPVARKLCRCEYYVFTSRTCVQYRTSKSFAAVHEPFSNAYPDKEVTSKTAIHRLVTKFRDTGSVWTFFSLLEENERDCWFQNDGATARIANTTASLRWVHCWVWPLATPISRPYPTRLLSLGISQRKSLFK
jgi:hypothetical protein